MSSSVRSEARAFVTRKAARPTTTTRPMKLRIISLRMVVPFARLVLQGAANREAETDEPIRRAAGQAAAGLDVELHVDANGTRDTAVERHGAPAVTLEAREAVDLDIRSPTREQVVADRDRQRLLI